MKNYEVEDNPIKEKKSSIFGKLNCFEDNDEYELEKAINEYQKVSDAYLNKARDKKAGIDYDSIKSATNMNDKKFNRVDVRYTDYDVVKSVETKKSKSLLSLINWNLVIFVTIIAIFIGIVKFNNIKNAMLAEERIQEVVTTVHEQGRGEMTSDSSFSDLKYAKKDAIDFGDYGTIPTIYASTRVTGATSCKQVSNDTRFKGNTSILEIKYNYGIPNEDIVEYENYLMKYEFRYVRLFDGGQIYIKENDLNDGCLFVIISSTKMIYGAAANSYDYVFDL